MKRLILIDGSNYFFRGAWAGNLTANGVSVKYTYSFFRSIVNTIKQFERDGYDCDFVVCWDGGYSERLRISQEAVDSGLINKAYKQERRDARNYATEEQVKDKEEFLRQIDETKKILTATRIGQYFIRGEEADDLVGSFAKKYRDSYDDVVLISSDKDYYQLLDDNVRIWNLYKKQFLSKDFLKEQYNLDSASQWVDVGALAGESGSGSDTIFGVPGISYKTGSKLIAEHGSLENMLSFAKKHFADLLDEYGSVDKIQEAIDSGAVKLKERKKEFKVLLYEQVVNLAYELKKIRDWLDVELPVPNPNWKELECYFKELQFHFSGDNFGLFLSK